MLIPYLNVPHYDMLPNTFHMKIEVFHHYINYKLISNYLENDLLLQIVNRFFLSYSQSSNMLNQARLKVLKVREDHVRGVLDEARKRLGEVTKDQAKYSQILESLILQGLYQVSCQIIC